MTGAQRGGRHSKNQAKGQSRKKSELELNVRQIEYLLYQSTQGIHFMFENSEIARVLKEPTDEESFFTLDNMEKVQGLLSGFIEKETIEEKRSYLESLAKDDYELLIRAYFHLVENTILAHSTIRH